VGLDSLSDDFAAVSDRHEVRGFLDDEPDVSVDPRRLKIRVLALVDAVELEPIAAPTRSNVHPLIEHAGLNRLAVLSGQAVKGGRERIGLRKVTLPL
jgi:hypothetical protein